MAYLIAAIVMTLSVLEGHSFVAYLRRFVFVARHAVPLHLQSFLLLMINFIHRKFDSIN